MGAKKGRGVRVRWLGTEALVGSAHCPVPDTNSITTSTLAVSNRIFSSTITDFFYSQRSLGVLAILGGKITMGRHVQLQKNSFGSEAFCSEG